MPRFGGLRLSVFALTCAVGLATAASASAKEVVLEAGPLQVAPGSSRSLDIPPGLVLKQALLTRDVTLPEGGSYAATFKWYTGPEEHRDPIHAAVIDSATASVSGDVAPPVEPGADGRLTFDVNGAGASANLTRVGLRVDDAIAPTAAVGGTGSTMSAALIDPKKPPTKDNILPTHVSVWAGDVGTGLWKAVLYVDGVEAGKVEYVNDGNAGKACVDALNAGAPLPLENDCQKSSDKDILLDTTDWFDGPHTLAVKLYDAAGNVADVLKDYKAEFKNGRDPSNCSPSCSAQVPVAGGGTTQPNGANNGNNGSGGVAGASTTSCNSPRLSMELSQRPLKVSKGVPVLLSGKRYRFRGKLTCLINGKRRSASPKTPIELLNTIGKRTYRKGGATVRDKGAITLILAYKSSRTLVFRYTNPDGRRSQVKLKIKVVKKPR
jgi:hypothetical protein